MKVWIVKYISKLGTVNTARVYCKRQDIAVTLRKNLKVKTIPEIIEHFELRSTRGH